MPTDPIQDTQDTTTEAELTAAEQWHQDLHDDYTAEAYGES